MEDHRVEWSWWRVMEGRGQHEISVKWNFFFPIREIKPVNCNGGEAHGVDGYLVQRWD